jgi:hypothetical protein
LRRSMQVERLEFEDLPYMAEEVRMSGYRVNEKKAEGQLKLDDDNEHPRPEIVSSWGLLKDLWRGRGFIVWTST